MKSIKGNQYNIWWGPPKKFSTDFKERKISWLELFYDLVYVIVISRTTSHLLTYPGADGILDYLLFFFMIFWGWINGSMYHDLHGSQGIRTRLMTLWQMLAVAALAVTMSTPTSLFIPKIIFALIFLQGYITYLWWSVGIYDKNHRILNRPYTLCYLAALFLIIATLFVQQPYKRILFCGVLALNYLPPFVVSPLFAKRDLNLKLSSSMVERLGLFTIIVFGEAILGVINGTGEVAILSSHVWTCFALGILIMFELWWVFFALIADREIKSGFLKGQVMSLLYIPAMATLGIVGASFSELIMKLDNVGEDHLFLKLLFGISLSLFLLSTLAISLFLQYPKSYELSKKKVKILFISSAFFILLLTFFFEKLDLIHYLELIFCILFIIIFTFTRIWFKVELKQMDKKEVQ
ncbi:MAG TPA: low temperature requirement protein A [Hanamia sp.]|nr:low temperature requirement protein A [Hanamia sp.]